MLILGSSIICIADTISETSKPNNGFTFGFSPFELIALLVAIATLYYTYSVVRREKKKEKELFKEGLESWKIESVLKKNKEKGKPKFFRIGGPAWVDFKSGYVFERPEVEEILNCIQSGNARFVLIEGEKAAGKTVCSRTVAYKLATGHQSIIKRKQKIFILKNATALKNENIPHIIRSLKKIFDKSNVLLIIDECHFNPLGCEEFAEQISVNTKNIKVIFITRLSYERAVGLEPNRQSKIYELSENYVFRITSEGITNRIIDWYLIKNHEKTLSKENVEQLINISGNDLIFLGRVLLAFHDIYTNKSTFYVDAPALKRQVYNIISNEVNELRTRHPKAPYVYTIISTFYMFQISVEKIFLIQTLNIDERCIEILQDYGDLKIARDGSISMGHPSEARLTYESLKETNAEEIGAIESLYGLLPEGLVVRYLEYKANWIRNNDLNQTLFEREKIQDSFVNFSLGENFEQNLVRKILKSHFHNVVELLSNDPNDWFKWARIAKNARCINESQKLKKNGDEYLAKYPELITEDGLLGAAMIHRDFEENSSASELFKKAIEKYPKSYKIRFVYANFLRYLFDFTNAEVQYNYVLENSRDSISLSTIANYYWDRGNIDKASKLFQESIEESNLKSIRESRRISVFQSYGNYLRWNNNCEEARKYLSLAKQIAYRKHINPSPILNIEAKTYIREEKYKMAEDCYLESMNCRNEANFQTVNEYATFLVNHGDLICNEDGELKYPNNSAKIKAIEILKAWLEQVSLDEKHHDVLSTHEHLGMILYSKISPPNYKEAEEYLRKSYLEGSGSGNLQDAKVDHDLGKMWWRKYTTNRNNNIETKEKAKEYLYKAFKKININNDYLTVEIFFHIIYSGVSLSEFESREEKNYAEAERIYKQLYQTCKKFRIFQPLKEYAHLSLSYANYKLFQGDYEAAEKIFKECLKHDSNNLYIMTKYAELIRGIFERSYKEQDRKDFVALYWSMLRHPKIRQRFNNKTFRIYSESLQVACLGLASSLNASPFYKKRISLKILMYAYQKNKMNGELLFEIVDIIWKEISNGADCEFVEKIVIMEPNNPLNWYFYAAVFQKKYRSKAEIKKGYRQFYSCLGEDSCRGKLFELKKFTRWLV